MSRKSKDPTERGKDFETHFAKEFRKYLRQTLAGMLLRLNDVTKTPQPADYLLLCYGITMLLDLKLTSYDELPLKNIIPHQITQGAMVDGSTPYTRAGFVIRFENRDNETWYLSAKKVEEYVNTHTSSSLSRSFMEEHGIRIRTYKATPTSRTNNTYDFDQFLKDIKATCG